MTLTINLTDEQEAALLAYIRHPLNVPWQYDEQLKQNVPKPRYATPEALLMEVFEQRMAGVMATCPPPAVQQKLDARAALDTEIAAASKVSVGNLTDEIAASVVRK